MKGFQFAGIHAGIKKNELKDLGLIFSDKPCSAAALFTKNKVIAAPVVLGKEKLKNPTLQAVLVNSGNANCFTGEQGLIDAQTCSNVLSDQLSIDPDLSFVSSTGVIGAPLPMEKFDSGIPSVVSALDKSGINDFSQAILTTDTCAKTSTQSIIVDKKKITITGIAKGSGMIRPNMATMLAFICTDAAISSERLKDCLKLANEKSFNRISVDGDTSTNDTVLALANGCSGQFIDNSSTLAMFQTALDKVCFDLAKEIVKDGEGATTLVKITVKGAVSSEDAYKACDAIAHSNLVKTAIYGQDPNWGRITAAAGRSGAMVDPGLMDLFFDAQPLVVKGKWLGPDAEKKAAVLLKEKEIHICLDLNLGDHSDFYLFCDFSENYVKINADYRT